MDAIKNIANKVKGAKGGESSGGSGGDYLDQGVNKAGQSMGKDLSPEQTEQYSDYARTGYSKATGGKEIPIADKDAAGGGK